jgi:hypothetical protein
VDFGFLRKISLQNNGIARKIYEDSDAALQLQGFYKEISTPLLTDLMVEYVDVENTTRVEFSNYFNGSEILICGVFDPDEEEDPYFRTKVSGKSNGNDVLIEKEFSVLEPRNTGLRASTERLWAYLTIKELLEKMDQESDPDDRAEIKARALSLSLKVCNSSFSRPTAIFVSYLRAVHAHSELVLRTIITKEPAYFIYVVA